MPTLERKRYGGLSRIRLRISIPLGWPSLKLKRSPFTPATVAEPEADCCMDVTRSVPTIVPFESSGFSW
jgi:hypothetical protein